MLIEILAPSHTILPCVCKLFVIIVTPLCKGVKVVHVLFNNSQERVIDDGYTIIYWIIMTGKSESVMLKTVLSWSFHHDFIYEVDEDNKVTK